MSQSNSDDVHLTPGRATCASPMAFPHSHLTNVGPEAASQEIFGCPHCEKAFNRRENLSRHLKTHDPAPSHCCTICGKGFSRSDLRKRHETGHGRWDQGVAKRGHRSTKRRKLDPRGKDEEHSSTSSDLYPAHNSRMLDHRPDRSPMSTHQLGLQTEGYQNIVSEPHPQSLRGILDQPQDTTPGSQITSDGLINYHPYDPIDFAPFDFSSFLLPANAGPPSEEWFSFDFYSAMRETGGDWGTDGDFLDPSLAFDKVDLTDQPCRQDQPADELRNERILQHSDEDGLVSRISSPPNEASEEDKWPFQWNPSSRQILMAHTISIPDNHSLVKNHDPRFDITETTLVKLDSFLQPPSTEFTSPKGTFVLPSLKLINIFIGLFFKHFSPQMPVLHHATVNTNKDLPSPLLAAMVIIGAIYSHLKHTRRFAIVLLDAARWQLRIAVECNNSLMRSAMIIYAEALIVHTGLWCGNKRAFELAEIGRGALITYIRRVKFGEQMSSTSTQTAGNSSLDSAWRQWITEESHRRLAWVIYTLDSQFPSLLNLPPTISIGEIRNLGCPCDEEFWAAGSARSWKNLLGPASVPPSRSFAATVGPFLLGTQTSENDTLGLRPGRLLMLSLNPWSAFLVLVTMTHQIFLFSQEESIARTFMDADERDSKGLGLKDALPNNLFRLHSNRRSLLAESLSLFASAYLSSRRSNMDISSEYFLKSSHSLHKLSTILLLVPLSDLQNAIGKDGTAAISQAMANLTAWAHLSPTTAQDVAQKTVQTIISLNASPTHVGEVDTAPYSLITAFLCHVILWVFVSVSTDEQKERLLDRLELDWQFSSSSFLSLLKGSLEVVDDEGKKEHKKSLFKSGAEMLTRLGTWGASLNLALLLQRRTEL